MASSRRSEKNTRGSCARNETSIAWQAWGRRKNANRAKLPPAERPRHKAGHRVRSVGVEHLIRLPRKQETTPTKTAVRGGIGKRE